MSLLLLFNQNGATAAPVITAVDTIISIPNWGVPYKLPSYMKAIHYAPQRWKPPRFRKPF